MIELSYLLKLTWKLGLVRGNTFIFFFLNYTTLKKILNSEVERFWLPQEIFSDRRPQSPDAGNDWPIFPRTWLDLRTAMTEMYRDVQARYVGSRGTILEVAVWNNKCSKMVPSTRLIWKVRYEIDGSGIANHTRMGLVEGAIISQYDTMTLWHSGHALGLCNPSSWNKSKLLKLLPGYVCSWHCRMCKQAILAGWNDGVMGEALELSDQKSVSIPATMRTNYSRKRPLKRLMWHPYERLISR